MHPATEKLVSDLQALSIEARSCDFAQRGYHLEIDLEAGQVRTLAECMLKNDMYLVFVGGLHVQPATEVIYQFASFEHPCRVVARAAVDGNNAVPTISDIFQGANWHERETRDFFGVIFTGHPYLKPLILAEEDADLKPLLKSDADLKESGAVRWAPPEEPAAEKKSPNADDKKTEEG
ncbi:MAG: NADH-quinone oxidoreductase subunit C [Deltaproteobacteria bacterium]|nr:NADH-quinone oxidoreductase subunit C [Deltaproteobacteria bacterium]